jgi:hypothetical protein
MIYLGSCKKDRLTNDREKLVGKWRWVKTQYDLYNPSLVLFTPNSTGLNYKIEFKKSGKFIFSEGNSIIKKAKTHFETSKFCETNSNYECYHKIQLFSAGIDDIELSCYLFDGDTLKINRYPKKYWNDINGFDRDYWNVYVRE